jgi:hypothetical protein
VSQRPWWVVAGPGVCRTWGGPRTTSCGWQHEAGMCSLERSAQRSSTRPSWVPEDLASWMSGESHARALKQSPPSAHAT